MVKRLNDVYTALVMDALIILGAKYLFLVVLLGAIAFGVKIPQNERFSFWLSAGIAGAFAIALTKIAGRLYFDPRPFTHGVRALIAHDADNGFPSDHTVLSFAAATVVGLRSAKVGGILLLIATLVAICRVLVGVHTPLDVISGAVIGTVAGSLAKPLGNALIKRRLPTNVDEGLDSQP